MEGIASQTKLAEVYVAGFMLYKAKKIEEEADGRRGNCYSRSISWDRRANGERGSGPETCEGINGTPIPKKVTTVENVDIKAILGT